MSRLNAIADRLAAVLCNPEGACVLDGSAGDQREVEAAIAELRACAVVDDAVAHVVRELERATAKFPTWPTDPLHAVAVVNEEVGELNKAILQATYEPEKANMLDVGDEAVQAAAMALRFVMSLPRYQLFRCHQHRQDGST